MSCYIFVTLLKTNGVILDEIRYSNYAILVTNLLIVISQAKYRDIFLCLSKCDITCLSRSLGITVLKMTVQYKSWWETTAIIPRETKRQSIRLWTTVVPFQSKIRQFFSCWHAMNNLISYEILSIKTPSQTYSRKKIKKIYRKCAFL